MINLLLKAVVSVAAISALMLPAAQAESLKAETAGAGGCPYTVMVMNAKYAQAEGVDLQVNDGKTLTKSMLLAAQGKIDIASSVPAPYLFMQKGIKMYKKLGDEAPELAAKLRGMWGYVCGLYMPIVWDESPIKSWAEFKGKKIFTGPPSGAAAFFSEGFIRVMTGYEPNEDYEAIRLNWGSGQQAMRDGQLEVYMRPLTVPSALMEELTGIRPVRILGAGDKADDPAMAKFVGVPGRSMGLLKANTFDGVVNNDVDIRLPAFALTQLAGEHVSEDAVYKLTKSYWENIDEIHANAPFMSAMSLETAFQSLNIPLHVGAYKYYKEMGVTVPDALLPPELK